MKQLVHRSRQIDERTERDREHEAAETADHADHAADSADIVRIVHRDVLVDGGLAQRHEEAEHEYGHGERHQSHFQMEADGAVDRLHQVIGRRIRQKEGRRRPPTRKVQYMTRRAPIAIREMAAIGPEYAGGEREHRRHHAGGLDVDAVDLDEILRQPQRQCDEGAEHEEIVQRETPNLNVLQRLELKPGAGSASRFSHAARGRQGLRPRTTRR